MKYLYKVLSEKYTEVLLNEYWAQDGVTPEQDKDIFSAVIKKYLPVQTNIDDFYKWFNTELRIEYGFGPLDDGNESSWGIIQQITYVAGEDRYNLEEDQIGKKFEKIAKVIVKELYHEYLNKTKVKEILNKDNPGVDINI